MPWHVSLLSLCLCGSVAAADFNVNVRVVPEYHSADNDSPFVLPEDDSVFNDRSSRQEIDLLYQRAGVQAHVLLRNQVRRGRSPENGVILNTLYWDTHWLGQDISLGKKVMSWGVGFGFRPLDVIQQEDRRRLDNEPLEGVPLLAWERFSATRATSLIIANPHHGKARASRDDASFILKTYQLQGAADLHGVLRLSERHNWEAGGGISYVIGDHLAWHASLLYQRRYQRWLNPLAGTTTSPLAPADPLRPVTFNHGLKALAGASWTGTMGWSLLSEVWYDEQAYTRDQWRDLTMLTVQQRSLLAQADIPDQAVFSNIAASSQYFQASNLLRWNTLVHLSYAGENLDPSLDILYTPEDQGYVVTFNLDYEGDKHQLNAALRRFGGPSDAAYSLLPERWIAWFGWTWVIH